MRTVNFSSNIVNDVLHKLTVFLKSPHSVRTQQHSNDHLYEIYYPDICRMLASIDEEKYDDIIEFQINSIGGQNLCAYKMYDLIKNAQNSTNVLIRMVNVEKCNSAAIYPFLSVPKEQRFAVENSTFDFHRIAIDGTFDIHGLKIATTLVRDAEKKAYEILKKELKWNRKTTNEIWDSLKTFSAEEAKEVGIISNVIKTNQLKETYYSIS